MPVLERSQVVPHPRHEVFPFFADAANLERLTPPFLGFEIVSQLPDALTAGTVIDYRIKLKGLPMKWRTLIEVFEPEDRFVDVQLEGPYKLWRHLHTFRDVPGGTEIGDHVEYALPFGPLGAIAHALVVKRQLQTIFDYRARIMTELFC
ncbi:MAG: SRPBCC family protein [Myxococcota bacterium]|nr:SRPBCC family protein [Myxococcota bacterium]